MSAAQGKCLQIFSIVVQRNVPHLLCGYWQVKAVLLICRDSSTGDWAATVARLTNSQRTKPKVRLLLQALAVSSVCLHYWEWEQLFWWKWDISWLAHQLKNVLRTEYWTSWWVHGFRWLDRKGWLDCANQVHNHLRKMLNLMCGVIGSYEERTSLCTRIGLCDKTLLPFLDFETKSLLLHSHTKM